LCLHAAQAGNLISLIRAEQSTDSQTSSFLTLFVQAIRMLFDCFADLLFPFEPRDRAPIHVKHTLAIRRATLSWRCASLIALTRQRRAPLLTNIASSISYGHFIVRRLPAAASVRYFNSPHPIYFYEIRRKINSDQSKALRIRTACVTQADRREEEKKKPLI
jgi:hypothetical protein